MKVVVGDGMHSFAAATGAVTLSELLNTAPGQYERVLVAQGLDTGQVDLLRQYCDRHNLNLVQPVNSANRAGRTVTHKHNLHNGLISTPIALADDLHEAQLLIDDRSELMLDHGTGCHIQGMVLIEAIRQMFIAVSEVGYRSKGVPSEAYVVFNKLDIRFNSFTFPVSATLRQSTYSFEQRRPDRASFKARVEVIQNGMNVVDADVAYTLFTRKTLEPKERQKAISCLQDFIDANKDNIEEETIPFSVPGLDASNTHIAEMRELQA